MSHVSWEFPWLNPGHTDDAESTKVTGQGAWVLMGEIAGSGLGFVFWALAARLFTTDDVGIAATLVSLSSLGTSIAILGLDNGLVRFASKVDRPRRLIRQVLMITGIFGIVVGLLLATVVLTISQVAASGGWLLLVGTSVLLTVGQICYQVTDGVILAAGKSHLLAIRSVSFGLAKLGLIVTILSAGAVGLFAAYTFPVLVIVMVTFLGLPRLWPAENPRGRPHPFKEIASLSAGNWISGFLYSLPSRIGPSLILIFMGPATGPATVAFFFISLQLAEILNYVSESVAKSLFAHGSREDRLTRTLTTNMRGLLLVVLVPLVGVGMIAAPFALSIIGDKYTDHSLSLILFLLAALPKSWYQVLKAQFNVERRPVALIIFGGTMGISTLVFLLVGLILRVNPDLLAASWILGGILALAVGQYLAGWRPRLRTRGLATR